MPQTCTGNTLQDGALSATPINGSKDVQPNQLSTHPEERQHDMAASLVSTAITSVMQLANVEH